MAYLELAHHISNKIKEKNLELYTEITLSSTTGCSNASNWHHVSVERVLNVISANQTH